MSVVALLAGGCLLISAGVLDLAVAIKISSRMHRISSAVFWWVAGMLGVSTGLVLLWAPQFSVQLLAYFAAAHAMMVAIIDACLYKKFQAQLPYPRVVAASTVIFVLFACGLAWSAIGTDRLAMAMVAAYSIFFGLRMFWLGAHQPPTEAISVPAIDAGRVQIHARI